VVGLSVTLVSHAKTATPIEMPFGLRTRVGPGNHVLDGGQDPPMGRGNFEGGKGHPIVKYRETLRSSLQKQPNRLRWRLGCGLGWAVGIVLDGGPDGADGRCYGNQFWDAICYNWLCGL